MRLFQRGVAQFQTAESSGDQKMYLDAGLSFMRVVIHYPGSGFAGPLPGRGRGSCTKGLAGRMSLAGCSNRQLFSLTLKMTGIMLNDSIG